MFFKTISRLKFLTKSTNQHGVHSPFVFDFVTKGLYKKSIQKIIIEEQNQLKHLSNKKQKILYKIVTYFNIDVINFEPLDLKKKSKNNYNLLFLKAIEDLNISYLLENPVKYFVVVDGIHRNKKTELQWFKIIKNKEISVTIDLFYFGLIFFRKEQAKEHFNIRA